MQQGSLLAGKYRLESLLGEGGMGAVWRAEHLDLHAPVAVKLLNPIIAATSDGLSRFHREATAAASLRSPHVVQILDRGVDEATRQPFIVMELMEGESLAGRIARQTRLSPARTATVVTHIARALARAHEAGIVHRDLKPDNVFLIRNEDEEIAKVLDFGIAKTQAHKLGGDVGTRTGAVMGTPYYMSPEQISGAKGVDFRSDLFALGVIACECLTGRRPFDADSIGGLALKICVEPIPRPSELGQVPPGFDAWFERAVSRDPAGRFRSAREMAEELRRVCGVTGVVSDRATEDPVEPFPGVYSASTGPLVRTAGRTGTTEARPQSAGGRWLFAGGALLVAALAGGFFWMRGAGEGAPVPEPSAAAVVPSEPVPAAVKPVAEDVAPLKSAEPVAAPPPASAVAPIVRKSPAPPAVRTARPPAPRPAAPVATAASATVSTVKPAPVPAPRPAGLGTAISDRR
jgi:serine/threonine-protein kinase